MNKKLFLVISLLLSKAAFANNLNITVGPVAAKLDYKEYINGAVVDKQTTNFGSYTGLKGKINYNIKNLTLYAEGEYLSGNSKYTGGEVDNNGNYIPIKEKNYNDSLTKYILGINYNIYSNNYYGNFVLNTGYGHREWVRGYDPQNPEDYKEVYYWNFYQLGIKWNKTFYNGKWNFNLYGSYRKSISPKLTAYTKNLIGTNQKFKLGNTFGFIYGFNVNYNLSSKFAIGFEIKENYWHIHKSDVNNLGFMEPESKTYLTEIGLNTTIKF